MITHIILYQSNSKNKTTIREYNLLTWNHPSKQEGTIENRIGRSKINRQKMSVTNLVLVKGCNLLQINQKITKLTKM